MSETATEPTAPTTPTPAAEDRRPRRAIAAPKSPPTDPEAPYGWMNDPKTGERRPKKRPGKAQKTEPPPRERASNRPRTGAPGSTKTDAGKIANDVGSLVQGAWLLLAAVPEADWTIPGTKAKLADVSLRTRAQAAILEDNGNEIVKGFTIMAQHSKPVARLVARAGEETGPAWILPAMLALMPFVVQSAAMWSASPKGDVEKLAKRTADTLDAMLKGNVQPNPEPGASPNGDQPSDSGAAALPRTTGHADTAIQAR